jgi:uncharacterized Zn finger protein (UPF0148 family)
MAPPISPLNARQEFQKQLVHGLVAQPITCSCSGCGKGISSDMEWRCGYCDCENRRTTLYSVLYKCQSCDRAPSAVICPYCEQTVALTERSDLSRPARYAPKKAKESVQENPSAQKQREHNEKKKELEQKIEIAHLEARLNEVHKPAEDDSAASAREKVRKRIKALVGQHLDVRLAIKECRAELAAECKDDPELLADLDEALTWVYENELRN